MGLQRWWAGAVALLVVGACGCSSGAAHVTSATTTSTTTTSTTSTTAISTTTTTLPPLATLGTLPRALQATFAVDLKPSDVQHNDEAGFWYLTLTPAHGYAFGRVPSDPLQNTGVLTVSGATLTFSAERGEGPCPGAGKYRWTATGDTVSFTLVDDSCVVRDDQTTAHPYRRCSGGPSTCVRPG